MLRFVTLLAFLHGSCGFLVGGVVAAATPRSQQVGELVGVITSAGFVCLVVGLLDRTVEGGLGGPELPAPQGVLMKLVIDGVLDQNLPWALIGIGVVIALVVTALRVPVLPFAVGVYLPLYTMGAVFVAAHWSACLWALQASLVGKPDATWLVTYGYCASIDGLSDEELLNEYSSATPLVSDSHACLPPWHIYSAALY